jgi:hypothetical protein
LRATRRGNLEEERKKKKEQQNSKTNSIQLQMVRNIDEESIDTFTDQKEKARGFKV